MACATGAKGKQAETMDLRPARSQVLVATLTPAAGGGRSSARLALDTLATSIPLAPSPTAPTTPLIKTQAPSTPTPNQTKAPQATSAAATPGQTATPPTASPTRTATPSPTPTGSVTGTPAPTSTPGAGLSQYEAALLQLHNQQRGSSGLPALVADPTLEAIARQRAQTMAQTGSFSHYNPNGTTVFDMMNARGYAYTDGAENIHYNYGYDDSESVQVAMDSFMNSAPHRANILKPTFHRVGIGIAHADNGTVYYSVVFSN